MQPVPEHIHRFPHLKVQAVEQNDERPTDVRCNEAGGAHQACQLKPTPAHGRRLAHSTIATIHTRTLFFTLVVVETMRHFEMVQLLLAVNR